MASSAQVNFVVNGSFEEIDSCYGNPSALGFDVFQWTGCNAWTCPTYGSSDLWCEDPKVGPFAPPFISGLGYQVPKDGDNMAGIAVFDVPFQNYREYIQNEMFTQFTKDKYYRVAMYISVAEYDKTYSQATSCMQVYISEKRPTQNSSFAPLPFEPQISNDSLNFYTDTLNWILFDGIYKAEGNEKFITIGCFDDSTQISLTNKPTDSTGGLNYFFVDDVVVEELEEGYIIPNVFSPNGDHVNDIFSPQVYNIDQWKCNIYNRWGKQVANLNEKYNYWDGFVKEGVQASEGTYFYVFETSISGHHVSEQGFFQLLR